MGILCFVLLVGLLMVCCGYVSTGSNQVHLVFIQPVGQSFGCVDIEPKNNPVSSDIGGGGGGGVDVVYQIVQIRGTKKHFILAYPPNCLLTRSEIDQKQKTLQFSSKTH